MIGPIRDNKILFSRNFGGIATVFSEIIKHLNENRFEFEIIPTGRIKYKLLTRPLLKNLLKFPWVIKQAISLGIKIGPRDSFMLLGYYWHFSNINFDQFSLVHVHGTQGRIIDIVCILTKKPIVLTIHSYHRVIELSRKKQLLEIELWKKLSKKIKVITHVSETDEKKGNSLGFYYNSESVVIPNFVNGCFSKLNVNSNTKLIFVGSLIERKGIRELVNCVNKNEFNNISHLHVCGEGPLKAELKNIANQNIQFHGFLKPTELSNYYKESSILVVPSKSESFGMVYLEGVQNNLSIIGYSEVIYEFWKRLNLTPDEKQIMIPFDHAENNLSFCIQKALNFRKTVSYSENLKSIQEKIKATYSIESIADEYLDLYNNIMSKNPT